MEIEVTILSDVDEDELYFDTKTLLQHLDLSKVKNVNNNSSADKEAEEVEGRRKASRSVRKGYEFRGINFAVSERVYGDPSLKSSAVYKSILLQPVSPTLMLAPSPTPLHTMAATRPLTPPASPTSPLRPPSPAPLKSCTDPPNPTPPVRGRSLDGAMPSQRNSLSVFWNSEKEREEKPDYMSLLASTDEDYVNDTALPLYMSPPTQPLLPQPKSPAEVVGEVQYMNQPLLSQSKPPAEEVGEVQYMNRLSQSFSQLPRSPRSSPRSRSPAGPSPRHSASLECTRKTSIKPSGTWDIVDMKESVDSLKLLVAALQEEVGSLVVTVGSVSGMCKQLQSEIEALKRGNKVAPKGVSEGCGI
jgi:hypothetical protein